MKDFFNTLPELCFPPKAIQVPEILEKSTTLQHSNFNQVFLYLSHKHAITQEDILELYHYHCNTLDEFLKFFHIAWECIDTYIVRFQEKAIVAYEQQLDIDNLTEKVSYYETLYKMVAKRYVQLKKEKN